MSHPKKLVQKSRAFCMQIFNNQLPANLIFHNYHHTASVVAAALEIGANSGLIPEELELVTVAAWFHDTGYCCQYKGHEETSKSIASEFLQAQGVSSHYQASVMACIEGTKQPQQPATLLQQVLCDADLNHVGKRLFPIASLNLKKELEAVGGNCIPDQDWHRQNVSFLEKHAFFTPYACQRYSLQKNRNLQHERELLL